MSWSKIRALDLSDIHTGHALTPTENILDRLKKSLIETCKKNEYQFIFISGDFFDHLLNLPSEASKHIQTFIAWLLKFCKRKGIRLRVLEGTPSHDWKQNYLFIQTNIDYEIGADVKYYDKLSIDVEPELGLKVLYVPDEWDEDPKETERQVFELLRENHMETVDLAIMHGMFNFQLPEHIQLGLPFHDQSVYESIVEHLIVIGHDHTHKRNGKVVVPGSFDRICHNDEIPKGYIDFTLFKNGKTHVTFIENKDAEIYKSIHLTNVDVQECLKEIDRVIHSLPLHAKVRLVFDETHPIITYLQELTKTYPTVYWSKPKIIREKKQQVEIKEVIRKTYTAVVLNPENITDKLLEQIESKHANVDPTLARELMKEVVTNVRHS